MYLLPCIEVRIECIWDGLGCNTWGNDKGSFVNYMEYRTMIFKLFGPKKIYIIIVGASIEVDLGG